MDAGADISYGGGKKMQQLKRLKISRITIFNIPAIHTTYKIEVPLKQKRETELKRIEY